MDVAIIGSGPAGVSAALTLKARGKSVTIISNDPAKNPLAKAPVIDNYPGLPGVSGAEMMESFVRQIHEGGIELIVGHVISIVPFGEEFMVSVGADVVSARSVILTVGKVFAKPYPGEDELLGRGVSYCATCDGMLYRGKRVCVVGNDPSAPSEASFLAGIGCEVTFAGPRRPEGLSDDIEFVEARKFEIEGADKLEALIADDKRIECDAVFVLRPTLSPANLVSGLEVDGPCIVVDGAMRTNIPGLFAAGDCVGEPYQVAKAVGEGQIAAFSAVSHLEGRD